MKYKKVDYCTELDSYTVVAYPDKSFHEDKIENNLNVLNYKYVKMNHCIMTNVKNNIIKFFPDEKVIQFKSNNDDMTETYLKLIIEILKGAS